MLKFYLIEIKGSVLGNCLFAFCQDLTLRGIKRLRIKLENLKIEIILIYMIIENG